MERRIEENLERVRERIRRAARRAGRSEEDVTLIAVTKTVPAHVVETAARLGVLHIGENRVQEAREKFPSLGVPVVRHMIGRLQTNKVRHVGDLFDWIHSLDRPELVQALARRAGAEGRIYQCLVQVNVAGEASKAGVAPDRAEELIRLASASSGIAVRGLMTIAPYTSDERTLREVFSSLRTLARSIERLGLANVTMEHLSMGMSHDFEIAIEEGATMVRVGSAIFGPRT